MSDLKFLKIFLSFFIVGALISCNSEKKKNEEEPIVVSSGDNDTSTSTKTSEEGNSQKYEAGKKIYSSLCISCHMTNGQGIAGNFPPLDGSNWLTEKREKAIHAVKYGLNGSIEVNGNQYNNVMPPTQLTDQQVSDVLNYVMHSWGNTSDTPVTLEEVKAVKE